MEHPTIQTCGQCFRLIKMSENKDGEVLSCEECNIEWKDDNDTPEPVYEEEIETMDVENIMEGEGRFKEPADDRCVICGSSSDLWRNKFCKSCRFEIHFSSLIQFFSSGAFI